MSINIKLITEENWQDWFQALDQACPDSKHSLEHIDSGVFTPYLRLIIEYNKILIGRVAARRREDSIICGIPRFKIQTRREQANAAMRVALREILIWRKQTSLENLAVEAQPGDDLPLNDLWLKILLDASFEETSRYSLYILPLTDTITRSKNQLSFEILDANESAESVIVDLHAVVFSDTLDRRDYGVANTHNYINSIKGAGLGFEPRLWLTAQSNGLPVGIILSNPAVEESYNGLSAWILEIGVTPSWRKHGIGSLLLEELIFRARAIGIIRLLAAIDDINIPSIELHKSLGFFKQPGLYYEYNLQSKLTL